MRDENQTREQLIAELVELRRQNADLNVALKQAELRAMRSAKEDIQNIR